MDYNYCLWTASISRLGKRQIGALPDLSEDDVIDFYGQLSTQKDVVACWVTHGKSKDVIIGIAPKRWSPHHPFYHSTRGFRR